VKGWEVFILLGPTEKANLKHWAIYASITIFTYAPEIRFHQWELRGKVTIKIVERHIIDLKLEQKRSGKQNASNQTNSKTQKHQWRRKIEDFVFL
jgi:hypothetical protein